MYKILDISYIDKIEKVYNKYHFSYNKEIVKKNLTLGRIFGRIQNDEILDLVIVNEREIGFNVFVKISDNFCLEKIIDFLNTIDEKIYLMDICESLKNPLLSNGYIEKDILVKYELTPYEIINPIVLEKVAKEDLEIIKQIDNDAFGEFWKQGEKRIISSFKNENLFFYKYTLNDKIVAYTLFNKNHIMRLAVSPEFQGNNIGKNIMKFIINKLHAIKAEKVTLNTQISNSKSRPLYENLGFVEKEISYVLEKI